MYSLVLSYQRRPALRMLQQAHEFVLGRIADALSEVVPGVQFLGTSDLALDNQKKFSGNSMRCRRSHLLYHGTLLYAFPLELIRTCLAMPPRQPDYRQGRSHTDFVANLPVARETLRRCLIEAWQPEEEMDDWPRPETEQLAADTYGRDKWNQRL